MVEGFHGVGIRTSFGLITVRLNLVLALRLIDESRMFHRVTKNLIRLADPEFSSMLQQFVHASSSFSPISY